MPETLSTTAFQKSATFLNHQNPHYYCTSTMSYSCNPLYTYTSAISYHQNLLYFYVSAFVHSYLTLLSILMTCLSYYMYILILHYYMPVFLYCTLHFVLYPMPWHACTCILLQLIQEPFTYVKFILGISIYK